jgi:hypothetical protein
VVTTAEVVYSPVIYSWCYGYTTQCIIYKVDRHICVVVWKYGAPSGDSLYLCYIFIWIHEWTNPDVGALVPLVRPQI